MVASHCVIFVDPQKHRGRKVAWAFAEGCAGAVSYGPTPNDGPIAVWGMSPMIQPILAKARSDGRDWYYIDNNYLGRRGRHFRVTKNDWQTSGSGFGDPRRATLLHTALRPWQDNLGGPILICPPSEDMCALRGWTDPALWLAGTINEIRRHTDRRIWIRNKPKSLRRQTTTFDEALQGVYCVVTHISNTAIEAVVSGIPAFVTGECAARPMCRTDLSEIDAAPFHPDRKHWFSVLAANQFSLEELRDGTAWNFVNGTG